MIIDACAFVGKRPHLHTPNHSVDDLLRLMDKSGIDRAAVTPLSGAFYQNAQEANEEIAPDIAKHSDRLMLVAAINPAYPGWEWDLERSRNELSVVGVRLFPNYHAYDLASPEVASLVDKAADMNLPVFIQVRLWDERHHPPAFMVPAVPAVKVVELAAAHPKTTFALSMGRYGEITSVLKQAPNVWADIAGVQGPTNCIRKLSADVGPERLLFGTELMLQYALPARYKMDYCGVSQDARKQIYSGNLTGLLPLATDH